MALLANKTADGMLGLRWSKIKLGCGSSAVVKTVQASHVGRASNYLGLQAQQAPCGLKVTAVQRILHCCRYSLLRQHPATMYMLSDMRTQKVCVLTV